MLARHLPAMVTPERSLSQLFVVPDRQLQVLGNNPGLLVVPGSVAGQLE